MKILVLGKGFLGQEFESMGYEVWGKDRLVLRRDTQLEFLGDYDVVINCIGISDTRFCELPENFPKVLQTNSSLPYGLSRGCEFYETKFVHISTGCLYDEIGRPCSEDDFLAAHCGYTVSKYAGEIGCNKDRDLILRPRLLFSDKRMNTHNNLLQKLPKFNSFVDELNSVTWNKTIVEATQALLDHEQTGVFNVANEGRHTIYEIATEMLGLKGDKMSGEQLRSSQGLYLVNNVMDISKLKQFYQPVSVEKAVEICYDNMTKQN